MIRSIVTHRNNCIQPVLERFLDLLKKSDKHSHVKLVDQIDIEAFIGILSLRCFQIESSKQGDHLES